MPEQNMKWVRIKPDRRGQFATKRYSLSGVGIFDAKKSWYKVPESVAEQLTELRVNDDPDGPLLFDVVSEDEAHEIDERGKRVEEKADASRPHTLSTAERTGVTRAGLSAGPTTGQFTTGDLPKTRFASEGPGDRDETGTLNKVIDPDPDGDDLKEKDEGIVPVGHVGGTSNDPKESERDPDTGEPRHHLVSGKPRGKRS